MVNIGDQVVTVARDGARMAGHGKPIYITAVYVARARVKDGVLTWRLDYRTGRATSGGKVSGPMIQRAKEVAAERGLPFVPPGRIRHGERCVLGG